MKRRNVIFLFVLFGLTGCFSKKETINKFGINDSSISDHSYEEIDFCKIDLYECFLIDSDDYYLYFYSNTCSHCSELKNYIIDKAIKNQNIYFIAASNKVQLTKDENLLIGAEKPGDIYIFGYPSLIEIKDKKCVKNVAGVSQIKLVLN